MKGRKFKSQGKGRTSILRYLPEKSPQTFSRIGEKISAVLRSLLSGKKGKGRQLLPSLPIKKRKSLRRKPRDPKKKRFELAKKGILIDGGKKNFISGTTGGFLWKEGKKKGASVGEKYSCGGKRNGGREASEKRAGQKKSAVAGKGRITKT